MDKSFSLEGVSKNSLREAGLILYRLKDSAENQDLDRQAKEVSNWKNLLTNLGDKARGVLGVAADILSVASPVFKLLGLPGLP